MTNYERLRAENPNRKAWVMASPEILEELRTGWSQPVTAHADENPDGSWEMSFRTYRTPDTSLPPLAAAAEPRRKMLVEVEVSANFGKRLDNQWEVEREINADRWSWRWADEV